MITLLSEPGTLAAGAVVALRPAEARHWRVRRGRPGDRIRLVDGRGAIAEATVMDREGQEVLVLVDEVRHSPAPPPLILAVGGGARERFAWLVEKAAELGVTDLIPLETERTAGVAGRVRTHHVGRLQARARQAIKQCGAAWAPVVHLPHTLVELVAQRQGRTCWLADPAGGQPQSAGQRPLLVAVGPEGGFTEAERGLLLSQGFTPVRLGPHTLRFETAAIAAAVLADALRSGEDR
jgi:16S rRNA (uracil1498-N3)-methyltransferase